MEDCWSLVGRSLARLPTGSTVSAEPFSLGAGLAATWMRTDGRLLDARVTGRLGGGVKVVRRRDRRCLGALLPLFSAATRAKRKAPVEAPRGRAWGEWSRALALVLTLATARLRIGLLFVLPLTTHATDRGSVLLLRDMGRCVGRGRHYKSHHRACARLHRKFFVLVRHRTC